MAPRERVLKALAFQEADIVPYDIRIDEAARPKLAADALCAPLLAQIDNHLPFFPLEARNRWLSAEEYVDEFGCAWRAGAAPHLVGCPLREPSLQGYRFPDPGGDGERMAGAEDFLACRQDHLTFCGDAFGFYDRCWSLRGPEEFLMDTILHPHFVQEMLEHLTEWHLRLIDRIAAYPFDGLRFGDDWGAQRGMVIGPERWRRFFKPGLQRIFAHARAKGLVVMVHSCGDITEIVPDLIDMGVQILNPLQPEAMDILEIKRRFGRHLCLNGGISAQLTLPRGTEQEVRAEVQACLRYLGQGGGYVISPAKPILPDVPAANAAALIEEIVNQPVLERSPTEPLSERVPELWRVYSAYRA